mmetsp:Transcript_25120/g.42020  ORF Transcript_25120/g.42020 Transcript_25120/m.42020 type:complete len:240 (-) Transcript_25120:115-834(-)
MDLADIVRRIQTAERDLSAGSARGEVPVQPKGEYALGNQTLVHHIVEGRHDALHANLGEPQAKDPIEVTRDERQPWLSNRLSKALALDLDVADRNVVSVEHAREGSRAVCNGEGGSVGFVGRGACALVRFVQPASRGAAFCTWNPEVGRASVHDDLEGLRGCSNLDFREVLGVLVVIEVTGFTPSLFAVSVTGCCENCTVRARGGRSGVHLLQGDALELRSGFILQKRTTFGQSNRNTN